MGLFLFILMSYLSAAPLTPPSPPGLKSPGGEGENRPPVVARDPGLPVRAGHLDLQTETRPLITNLNPSMQLNDLFGNHIKFGPDQTRPPEPLDISARFCQNPGGCSLLQTRESRG